MRVWCMTRRDFFWRGGAGATQMRCHLRDAGIIYAVMHADHLRGDAWEA